MTLEKTLKEHLARVNNLRHDVYMTEKHQVSQELATSMAKGVDELHKHCAQIYQRNFQKNCN